MLIKLFTVSLFFFSSLFFLLSSSSICSSFVNIWNQKLYKVRRQKITNPTPSENIENQKNKIKKIDPIIDDDDVEITPPTNILEDVDYDEDNFVIKGDHYESDPDD